MGRGRIVKLAFLGTPDFAVPSLTRLHSAGHMIRVVLTQPDRPAGRGRKISPSPIKRAALDRGLAVFQPEGLDETAIERIASEAVEAAVVVAYGLILPAALLRLPPHGCINLHASMLPRYRGAAPIAHAILRGETMTGVTTLLMDEGIDTGPILLQKESPLGPEETAGEVEKRLSDLGAGLLVETIDAIAAGRIAPRPQIVDRETYAPKIGPETARIAWNSAPALIVNLVRAMNPRPGATTSLRGESFKIWRAAAAAARRGEEERTAPGTVLAGGGAPRVACGEGGSVVLQELQREGRRRVSGEEAVRGRWLAGGDFLGEAKAL
jgi:methionyl-tRNA formyltransferase